MQKNSKQILIIIFTVLLAGYGIIASAVYEYTHKFAEDQNKKKLDQILLNQRAMHTYLEDQLKPVIYKLKEEGKLYPGFFDPKVLSFTYIARGIHEQLNKLRDEENTTQIYYKLATDNPRNPVNTASENELKILKMFRNDSTTHEFSKLIQENGHHYIYYAMAIEKNKESCMKCHSTPDKAPKELIERYGDRAGFGEDVGNMRAMISLKMPFDDELAEANEMFKLIMMIVTFFFIALFAVIVYFVRRLDISNRIIEEKNKSLAILAEIDGLTGIYNRRSFDNDLNRRMDEETLALIIFDIDWFKQINDTYGHAVGDDVLITIASLVKMHLRDTDYFYRIGGEEFAIISIGNNASEIKGLVERLLMLIGSHNFNLRENVHISAGIAFKSSGDTLASLFKKADDALYKAKESGRNTYIISND